MEGCAECNSSASLSFPLPLSLFLFIPKEQKVVKKLSACIKLFQLASWVSQLCQGPFDNGIV